MYKIWNLNPLIREKNKTVVLNIFPPEISQILYPKNIYPTIHYTELVKLRGSVQSNAEFY